MGPRVYVGRSARSRREPLVYCCPCGERFRVEVWRALDSADAHETQRLKEGALNRFDCPSCGAPADVQVAVVFHDLDAPRLVLVLPDSLRHRELEERARLLEALAADREPAPLYVHEAPVVFGAAGLRAILAPAPSEAAFASPAAGEAALTPRPTPAVAAPAPAPARRPEPELEPEKAPLPGSSSVPIRALDDREATAPRAVAPVKRGARERSSDRDSGVRTHVRVQVPDPRSAMIERWIAGREGPSAFLVDETVLVCAALPPAQLESFIPGPVVLRVQLHRLPAYPLLAVTLVAPAQGASRRADEQRTLSVPLDVARAAHRVVLDALQRKAAVTVELYDAEYLPVVTHHAEASLEENVKRLAADARDALERIAPQSRSFERAKTLLLQPGYDRLGRTPIDLPDHELETLERPAAVLAALAAVSRWSEPSAEAYLVEVGSVPLGTWRSTRARVIRRALDVGIAVPRALVEKSTRDHATPLPSWPELLALQLKRFGEVASRLKPNDLSAQEEADNWQLLLRECERAGVEVDPQVRQIAAASLKRARAGSTGGVDLRTLDTAELEALLERKELRREAALILCERRETPTLPTLFSAIRRMPRNEANVVLPAVSGFGPAVEKYLVEGLKSRRSFMRQGCALGLGALKTPLGVAALVRLLLFEPTEIWGEVARALGDVGPQAVMPLAARLRDVDAERRERIVQALAQIAARGVKGPVEMLAAGRDALVAQAAQRALALTSEVRAADETVRKGPVEQTVVRGFSRRFYEALGGSIELGPDDLEELEELDELDDESANAAEEEEEEGRTAQDLPALKPLPPEETTAPTPKTSLPRTSG